MSDEFKNKLIQKNNITKLRKEGEKIYKENQVMALI